MTMDIEFTIQEEVLYMLPVQSGGKNSLCLQIKIAVDMVRP